MDKKTELVLTIAKFAAYAGYGAGLLLTKESLVLPLILWAGLVTSGSLRQFVLYCQGREHQAIWSFWFDLIIVSMLAGLGYREMDVIVYFLVISECTIVCRLPQAGLTVALAACALAYSRFPTIAYGGLTNYWANLGLNGLGFIFAFAISLVAKRQIEQSEALRAALDQLAKSREELELAYREIVANQRRMQQLAVMEERTRMAREIHDTLAHSLTGIIVTMQAAKRLLQKGGDGLEAAIAQTEEQARYGLTEVRQSIQNLRSEQNVTDGWTGALTGLVQQVRQTYQVAVELELSGAAELRPEQEVALYRMVQEACTNAVRHGHCHQIRIEVDCLVDQLVATVTDDGVGCAHCQPGFGLRGMQERMQAIGGRIALHPAGGHGFQVKATIPRRQQEASADANDSRDDR